MRLATRNVSGRPLLSAVAGAKSREGPGQERHKAALKREHGSDEPFGANSRRSEWPARSARRGAKSELAQVRAHDDFEHSDRTQRASTYTSRMSPFLAHRDIRAPDGRRSLSGA